MAPGTRSGNPRRADDDGGEDLRRIVDLIPQTIVVLDPDGKALYANHRATEYTGLSLADVSADDFRGRVFHPADIERLREERQRCLAGTVPFENEQRVRRRDGTYRWFLIRYNPSLDESGRVTRWYASGTDIEDRRQAEDKLRQDEQELRQLIDFLPEHVIVLDKDGALLHANKTMLDYSGYTLDQMKGGGDAARIKRDVHPDDLDRVHGERAAGLSKAVPFEMEKRLLNKSGQFRWFLFRYRPVFDGEGSVVRWFASATDIEERKQVEDRVRNEAVALREDIVRSSMFEAIVGSSAALRAILEQVSRVAPTDSTVLIRGETGTGKELIARAIHNRSKRANRAFIRVNCAAIPSSLIASELFGHEKGAFTGALQRRLGRFESADGGTIFLDEVGELPPEMQSALLRVLQEREFERVGGSRPIHVDVRVLAATNRDLDAALEEGAFRKDLFYRLNVFPIDVPPLRERGDDIPLLVEYLVDRYATRMGKRFRSISVRTLQLLQNYAWPGNVRELQNVVERAVIVADGETFHVDASWFTRPAPASRASASFSADLAEREKGMIEEALRHTKGLISGPAGAAARLGLPRQTLASKIRKLGIDRYRFRAS
jgi:formate hydrogenlyase transcriptional activator